MYSRIIMVIYTEQHLSSIWSSIDEKVKQHWEKALLLKKSFIMSVAHPQMNDKTLTES